MVLQAGVPRGARFFGSVPPSGSSNRALLPPELAEAFEGPYGSRCFWQLTGATGFAGGRDRRVTRKDKKQWGPRKRGSSGRPRPRHRVARRPTRTPARCSRARADRPFGLEARAGNCPCERRPGVATTLPRGLERRPVFPVSAGWADDAIQPGGFKIRRDRFPRPHPGCTLRGSCSLLVIGNRHHSRVSYFPGLAINGRPAALPSQWQFFSRTVATRVIAPAPANPRHGGINRELPPLAISGRCTQSDFLPCERAVLCHPTNLFWRNKPALVRPRMALHLVRHFLLIPTCMSSAITHYSANIVFPSNRAS